MKNYYGYYNFTLTVWFFKKVSWWLYQQEQKQRDKWLNDLTEKEKRNAN